MEKMYESLGISSRVYEFGQEIIGGLKERFEKIDQVAEYNQLKVLGAMQKNRVSEACLGTSTGYGYNDLGRDTLERVYADTFHTEAALVRPQITCGTHALAIALFGNLRPGDELLSIAGKPYDTLEEAIRILKRDTRHFAKRQLTWFRREPDVIWVQKENYRYEEKPILESMLKICRERGIC